MGRDSFLLKISLFLPCYHSVEKVMVKNKVQMMVHQIHGIEAKQAMHGCIAHNPDQQKNDRPGDDCTLRSV